MPDHADDGRSASVCVAKRLERGDEKRWDAFVQDAPPATCCHWSAWRGVVEGLGHRSHYLYAERDGAITGVLPLAEVRSRLFGHALISTPTCVYGGVAATDAESAACLTQAATSLADELRVDYLELRNREPVAGDWPVKDLYVQFRKPLFADDDSNLKALPTNRRATVRKSLKRGLEAHHDGSVDEFYPVFAESVRNLGTPVLSRRYFASLQQAFGDACEITVITHQARAVATVLSFYFRDEVHVYYAGSLHDARHLLPNDFMYWAVMQRAAARGARVFDFGRSKRGTGSFEFKQYWGFEPMPLPYAYHLVRAREVPNLSPTNRKYHLFIEAWKRLPLPVSRAIGPWLAKDLG